MRTYTNWNKNKIEKLLEFVKVYEMQGKSNLSAFNDFAKKLGVKTYTIRNLYYKILREKGVTKKSKNVFSEDEKNWLLFNVQKLKQNGYSVRSACLKLANNDKSLGLRYINKYRKEEKIKISKGNIITIKPKSKALTDDDINNLIKGFVGLIKKNAIYELNLKYKTIIKDYNTRLNNTLIELNKKNNLLKNVLTENEILKSGKEFNVEKLDKILTKVKT